jgi:hypothetical protein
MTTDCGAAIGAQPCGCCTGVTQQTPEAISNRPALSSIAYRVGRYATFDASMLASLSGSAAPALASLRTRDPSDFSIALLDAWAVTLDILTFYQERFANEAFLRTAVDQRSVFELAGLVGYQPSPGVTASAVLAFTLSSAPGSPDDVPIPAGTRVQSVPGPGQTAQVFETSSALTAQIGWNALPAQTTIPWQLANGAENTWIAGVATGINPGDALLFVLQGADASNPSAVDVHFVTAVMPDQAAGTTQIWWDTELELGSNPPGPWNSSQVSIYAFATKAGLYGAQAPNPQTLPTSGSNATNVPGYPSQLPTSPTWDYQPTGGTDQLNLDASYPGLAPQPGGPPQWLVLTGAPWGYTYTSVFLITAARDTNPAFYTLTVKTTELTLTVVQILTGDTSLGTAVIGKFIAETPSITAYTRSTALTPGAMPLTDWTGSASYTTQTGMIGPVAGNAVSVFGGQQIAAGQPIAVSGRRVRLQVVVGQAAAFEFVASGFSSGSAASPGQVFLVNRYPPLTDPSASGNLLWSVDTLSGVSGTLSAPGTPDAVELLPADPKDATVGEAAIVQSVVVSGDITSLTLADSLSGIYDASTVTVNANAVLATDGQTVQEILGSGNAADDSLQFTLKQAPLTYVPAANSSGAQSTLQVWVNNLQWTEVPNLLFSGPADRAFVTAVNGSGNTVITFGNGVQGARTPTGTSNIRAVYRTGIGSAGMVGAGQLTQPLDRPSGLMSVTNPSVASGASDPATAARARTSAPLPTLTIGRVVSLLDYQNFALGFSGIAKASATWTWLGNVRGVFLTIAGSDGATLASDDPIVTNLISALQLSGEPYVPLAVASYKQILFTFTAAVAVDQPAYDPGQVLAQVWQALTAAFAFDQRQLGQNVSASEIIELIQQVPGVTALQLQALGPSGQSPPSPPQTILCPSGPVPPAGAQGLALDPATQGAISLWSVATTSAPQPWVSG